MRGKTRGVVAGLVPAISIRIPQRSIIEMAGTSPAMTSGKCHEFCPCYISRLTVCPQMYPVFKVAVGVAADAKFDEVQHGATPRANAT
jgi:hypothetical protein